MASEKTSKSGAAAVHAFFYAAPFVVITSSWRALVFIAVTHFIIDRWRLARYLVWAKNFLSPRATLDKKGNEILWWRPWKECKNSFGYPPERQPYMAIWLMMIADNLVHVVLNGVALKWF